MYITQTRQVKYPGLHLDTQLTWKQHTKSIINKIRIKRKRMYWLTSRSSKLSIENKLKIYKTIIKPIWAYGIPLCRTAVMSHINKLESLQSKILRTIVNASRNVRNEDKCKDLKIPKVKKEIGRYAEKYKKRTAILANQLATKASKTLIER